MQPTGDELAGIVDLFGALTHDELQRALVELAARTDGSTVDPDAVESSIDEARTAYALVEYPVDGTDGYVTGPAAFPEVPPHGEDLPHILDVPRRTIDREAVAGRIEARIDDAVAETVDAGDTERARELIDLSYDAEAWSLVELETQRETLGDLFE